MEIPAYEREAFEDEISQTIAQDIGTFARLSRQSGQRCYALVNAGQCGVVDENRQEDGWVARLVARYQLDATPLFLHTPEAAAAGVGPWLVELPSMPEATDASPWLHDLARGAGAVHALSLVASPLRPVTLAAHLRSWLDAVILPDPALEDDEAVGAVLRWFDPRIGFDMVIRWPDDVRQGFLSAFTWTGWDAEFHPHGLRCSKPYTPQSAARTAPMRLDKDLLLAMAPLNRADALLAHVHERFGSQAFQPIAPALQRWVALDQLQAVQQLGLSDFEDWITLLQQSLSLHPELSRLPGLAESLVDARGAGRTLAHVFEAQPAEWWQQQQNAAPRMWAQKASRFLAPLQARRGTPDAAHAFSTLFSVALPAA
ncbi:uncharacterized protein DUF4123 [Variovorax sp. 54]|uniref:DUF4123 domain-containing protein n=1 Tax=Variovorax sp. 54 TaxID=2035212 RepID=UPI000C39B72C|nr:DUF4123 domain-containing protein [Variovorax sp. 54]PIF75908.1 uncharacterized protein DUF4123 [Variovorax sp. 54]